jgi:4-amino-4-deoxy-L-arabinose transferase-like glycosyltransferase
MFQRLNHRLGHYLLLLTAGAALYLPNLGAPSLWDIDEGNNADCAREMMDAGNWIVPTFNYELRVDKPALLYWLQIAAYRLFGVNEFSARLPSALSALLAVLCTYELGRRMFRPAAGLLAGLVLASTVMFSAAAHFANPDALLNLCTLLSFLFLWDVLVRGQKRAYALAAISAGLAVLAKGPVGIVLPFAVTGLFSLWARRLRQLLDWRWLTAALVFGLVIAPWYGWVTAETRGRFAKDFFLHHNVNRYLSPMEGHAGRFYYYFVVLMVGFAPWSSILGLAFWNSLRREKRAGGVSPLLPTVYQGAIAPRSLVQQPTADARLAHCFLWCWIAVYFVFFTIARTKLPNYILPIYPAVALLTGHFLDRWRRGEVVLPAWVLSIGILCFALMGVGMTAVLLAAGGVLASAWRASGLNPEAQWPGVEGWGALGLVPLAGAAMAWWCLRRGRRTGVVVSFTAASVLFLGVLATWGATALEAHKAPKALVQAAAQSEADLDTQEVRVASYQYFQPSLVFYCRREVRQLKKEQETLEFLSTPLPVYLIVPAAQWQALESKVPGPHRVLGQRRDLYQSCDVVVVTNR